MAARKALSKRLRFEIFKRDGFRCVYCGATPVQSALHVDHVIPVAEGGTNEAANLATACAGCNQGKSAVPLEQRKLAPAIATEEQKDHAEQIREYLAIQRDIEAAREQAADEIARYWEQQVGPMSQDMFNRLTRIVPEWPADRLIEAIHITARRMGRAGQEFDPRDATKQAKYFQGILRNWRNGRTF